MPHLNGLPVLRAAIAALIVLTVTPSDGVRRTLPSIILWAWERPEDLQFIDPGRQGAAYLAATITFSGEAISVHARHQRLRVPDGTVLVSVVRLETDRDRPPTLSAAQRDMAAGVIGRIGTNPRHAAVQIDFDAVTTERAFYGALLREVRRRLPEDVPLSITALASWCMGDPWIAGLPIDEAVPMLFRMGADRATVLENLQAGEDFSLPVCRDGVGISTDEPLPAFPRKRRVYVFTPRPWKADTYSALAREIGR